MKPILIAHSFADLVAYVESRGECLCNYQVLETRRVISLLLDEHEEMFNGRKVYLIDGWSRMLSDSETRDVIYVLADRCDLYIGASANIHQHSGG